MSILVCSLIVYEFKVSSAPLKDLVEVVEVSNLKNTSIVGHLPRRNKVTLQSRKDHVFYYPSPWFPFVEGGVCSSGWFF